MQAEYDTALAILREGRYTDAAQAFKQFLVRHPTGPLSGNASYWLGETYYVTRDFDQSLATFTSLVNNFPQSPKLSDSRLKIGYIHYEKKDWKAARKELEAVVSTYPGTTAARLALRTGAALLPIRAERLGKARYRVTVYDPIPVPEGDLDSDAQAVKMTEAVHHHFEQWISEQPDQWICLKRRWPKAHKL